MFDLLIDDTGKVWNTFSNSIARRFGTSPGQVDVASDMVEKLGFVRLRSSTDGMTAFLRPGLTSRLAMIGAIEVIARTRPRRVLVSPMPHSRPTEAFADIDEALARIEQLAGSTVCGPIRPFYNAARRPLDEVGALARGRMEPILQLWHRVGARWQAVVDEELRRTKLLDRSVVCDADGAIGGLVIRHWGKKVDLVAGPWRRVAIGRVMGAYPYPAIGDLVAQTYLQTIALAKPQLAEVEVVVADGEQKIVHRRYDRLVLPWNDDEGRSLVTSVCFTRWTETYT